MSYFRRHQQRTRAQMSGAAVRGAPHGRASTPPPEPAAGTAAGNEYAALRVVLHDNLRTLSDIASVEARNPKKRDMAAQFADWIDGALIAGEAGPAPQDEILVTVMIWAMDYGDYDYALRLAAHAIRHALILPERYKRTAACFVAETLADHALANRESVTDAQLMQVLALTDGHDMPDQARAKLHKALGRALHARADAFDPLDENALAGGKAHLYDIALDHYRRALELDRQVGVKRDIEMAARALKKAGPTPEDAAAAEDAAAQQSDPPPGES